LVIGAEQHQHTFLATPLGKKKKVTDPKDTITMTKASDHADITQENMVRPRSIVGRGSRGVQQAHG